MFGKITKYRDFWSHHAYDSLETIPSTADLDEEKHDDDDVSQHRLRSRQDRLRQSPGKLVVIGILCLAAGLALGLLASTLARHPAQDEKPVDDCASPPTRREWRSLSLFEKSDFIHAVRCMAYEPSKTRPKGALFDDFPYVRAEFGHRSEYSREFCVQSSLV
jgi:hypothetical protein